MGAEHPVQDLQAETPKASYLPCSSSPLLHCGGGESLPWNGGQPVAMGGHSPSAGVGVISADIGGRKQGWVKIPQAVHLNCVESLTIGMLTSTDSDVNNLYRFSY